MLRTPVPTLLEMPLPVYDVFVDKCDQASRGFALLKNSVIVRRPKDDHYERMVKIRCDLEDAKKLLALATEIYPDAVTSIAGGIAAALKLDSPLASQQHTLAPLPVPVTC
jgi:hypothetical protein